MKNVAENGLAGMVGDGWVTARLSRGSTMTQLLGQSSPMSVGGGEYPVFWFHFLKVH
jgi:hypothetical protein